MFGLHLYKEKTAKTLNNLGIVRMLLGETAKAVKDFRESLRLKQERYGAGSLEVADAAENMGKVCYRNKQFDDTVNYFGIACQIHLKCRNDLRAAEL